MALRVIPLDFLKNIDPAAPESLPPTIGALLVTSIKKTEGSTGTSRPLPPRANVKEPAVLHLADQPHVGLSLIVVLHSISLEIVATGALHTRPEAGSLVGVVLDEDPLAGAETIAEETVAVQIFPKEDALDPLCEDVLEALPAMTTVTEVLDIDPGLHLGSRRLLMHLHIPLTHETTTP